MAKILLIKTTKTYASDKALSPPLGLLYLSAYLRQQRSADQIRIIDLRTVRHGQQVLAQTCRDFAPDIIAFSSMTIESTCLHEMARWCRQHAPGAIIIVGGPHAASFQQQILADPNIDYLLAGEGEIPFLQFVNAMEANQRTPAISGLSYKDANGAVVSSPANRDLVDLATLPMPAWDMIDFDDYTDARMSPISQGRYAALFTSRGCPYRCTYCHNIFPKRYRAMTPPQVVNEIEYLVNRYQIREFEIYDDSFNLNYQRAMAICDEIIRRGLKIRLLFPNGVRGDLLDEALIKRLRQAGTIFLAMAVESASPRIQKEIKKNNDLEKIRHNITVAAREGIFTWGAFMMGFVRETRRELWQTARYAITSDLHGAHFFIVIPQANTELGRQAGLDVSQYADIKATDYWTTKNTLACVSHWELWLWQMLAFFLFYANPVRIYRAIRVFPYPARVFCHRVFRRGGVFVWLTFFRNLMYRLHRQKKRPALAGRQAPAL
ncbi:MAG: radical SAM protein [Lentisphaerae bacterium]|nr:radical SAM protein [Lentisphaerota bacterium]